MKRLLFFVFLCSMPVSHIWGLLFIDIAPFHFKAEQKKGVRILLFDTTQQKIQYLHYVPLPTKRHLKTVAFTHPAFSVTFEGHVTLRPTFNSQSMVLRTYGTLLGYKSRHTPMPIETHPFKTLCQLLQQTPIPKEKPLPVFYGTQKEPKVCFFTNISSHMSTNNQERGLLGECLTDLTFLSLGFIKKEAQNTSNQGFDGIFILQDKPWIILTESKNRQESKTASNYMESDLNEGRLFARTLEIPDPALKAFLLNALDTHPWHVYKVVQRVLPSGFLQSAIQPVDDVRYLYARIPNLEKALPQQKKIFLKAVLRRLQVKEEVIPYIITLALYQPKRKDCSL